MDLLSRGINVNQRDKKGRTPLHYAAAHNRLSLAKEIINKGGDINIADVHGNNALWTAVFNARGNYELVELFVEKGGDSLTKNKYNRSPLDFANQINDKKLIELLTIN
jgi:ankyrin repeat protein